MGVQRAADEAGAQRDAARQQLADAQAQLGTAMQRAAHADAELSASRRDAGGFGVVFGSLLEVRSVVRTHTG